jgi:hypothetical protein
LYARLPFVGFFGLREATSALTIALESTLRRKVKVGIGVGLLGLSYLVGDLRILVWRVWCSTGSKRTQRSWVFWWCPGR